MLLVLLPAATALLLILLLILLDPVLEHRARDRAADGPQNAVAHLMATVRSRRSSSECSH